MLMRLTARPMKTRLTETAEADVTETVEADAAKAVLKRRTLQMHQIIAQAVEAVEVLR